MNLFSRQAETSGNAGPRPADPSSDPFRPAARTLRAEQIRLLYGNAPFGLTANAVNSLILTVILWTVVSTTALLAWLIYTLTLACGRFLLVRRFRQTEPGLGDLDRWGRLFIAGTTLSGLGWGSAALFLFPEHSVVHQVFVAFVLAGMSAGAVTTLSPVRAAFLGFTVPTLTPLALRFLAQGEALGYAMGGMAVLFTVILVFIALRMHGTLAASLNLLFANEDLISALSVQVREREQAQDKLRQAHDYLERRVQARTRDLAAAVERLRSEITERRRVEAALRESEARFRSIIESTPDGVIVSDQRGILLLCNGGAENIFGYGQGEMIGLPLTHLMPERFREAHLRGLERFVTTGESSVIGRTIVMTGLRKGGSEFPLELELSSWQIGVRRCVSAIIRDITERRQAEQHLQQAQKMEAMGRLAGGIAHDFNNLLTVITGQADLLLKRVGSDDPARHRVELIAQAAERAASLTKQLLAFSRQQALQSKVVDLNEVIRQVKRLLRRLIGEDVALTTVLDPTIGRIKANPGHVEQVILNLALNARDAMPHGGSLTIETKDVELAQQLVCSRLSLSPGWYVRLSVTDTGTGMDEDTMARIFDPFFTTKDPGKGTGLGLTTVYGILKQSGGTVSVSSAHGQGATFETYWPLVRDEADAPAPPPAVPPLPAGSPTILLVEDEDMVRDLAKEILQQSGYRVIEARDGHEAVTLCEGYAAPIHLLVTDVVMPGMSGRKLAERLRPLRPSMKLLYVSGYTSHPTLDDAGLDDDTPILSKPFTAQSLTAKIREILDEQ